MEEIKIVQNASLGFNFDKAKAELEEKVAPYRSLVFTEDTKKDAKETLAQLRKDQKSLLEQIRAIKAEYMKPFDAFAIKAHELVEMYEEPISFIMEQISEFEKSRKEQKKKLIAEVYDEVIDGDEISAFIPLADIYSSKWENATVTRNQIAKDILNIKVTAKNGIETIKSFKSDKEAEAIKLFKQRFDIAECVQFIQKYEAEKAEILRAQEERARAEELERVRAEERAKIEAEAKKEEEISQAIEQAQAEAIEAFIPEDTGEEIIECTYIIRLTKTAKETLEMYMDSIGLDYDELVM